MALKEETSGVEPESITRMLCRRAQCGDNAAYERLFSLHVNRLLPFIRARLGKLREKIEPDDVLQDAFLSAHRAFADFDYTDDGAFLRWLCRIIDNRLRDKHDYFAAQKRQEAPVPRSALTGPVTALDRAEKREGVERALQELRDEHREVLLLRYFGGFSAEETGKRMKRTAGAIRNLTARALVELGKHIGIDKKS